MTSEKPPTTETEALTKKIGAIELEVAKVKTVIRRSSRTRLALLLAVVVFLGTSIWMFYSLAMEFGSTENVNLLTTKARVRLDESSGPALRHVNQLKENCVPVLQKAFTAQVEKDKSKYADALTKERDVLLENLNSELNAKIRAHFEQISEKYQAVLRDEFPDLEDPKLLDAMYASVVEIMERLAAEYYSEQVQGQLQEMNDTWLEFEMAELPGPNDPRLEQQFVAALLRVASMKLDKKLAVFETNEEAPAPALAER